MRVEECAGLFQMALICGNGYVQPTDDDDNEM